MFEVGHFAVRLDVVTLGLITGVAYGLLGVGLVLIYRASRVVNFAHAAVGAVAAALLGVAVTKWHVPYWLGVPAALLVGFLTGALCEVIVVRRLRAAPAVMTVVATLGLSEVLVALGAVVNSEAVAGSSYPQPPWLPSFNLGALTAEPADTGLLVLTPFVVVGLVVFFRRSWSGRGILASAANRQAARLAGIPVGQMSGIAWGVAGALAAFSAILSAPSQGFTSPQSLSPELLLRALGAAVIARMDSFPVAMLAGIAIGVVEQLLLWNYPTDNGLIDAVLFCGILLVLLLQRRRNAREEDKASWLAVDIGSSVTRRPTRSGWRLDRRIAIAAAVIAAAIGLPLFVSDPNSNSLIFVDILCFAVVGMSVGVITGLNGQLSLGQFAIAGVGGVLSYHVTQHTGNFPLAIAVSLAGGGVAALIIGLPALRISGLMLAVTSLGFALTMGDWGFSLPAMVGNGVVPGRPILGGLTLSSGRDYYYYTLAIFIVLVALIRNIWRSGLGRKMRAVRDNEDAARAFAIPATWIRLQGFIISGAIAGVAGSVYAYSIQYLDATAFPPTASIDVVAMTVLGGIGLPLGPLIGALYIVGVPQFVALDQGGLAASAAGWLILILYFPGGLAQALRRRGRYLRGRGTEYAPAQPAIAQLARGPLRAARERAVAAAPGGGMPLLEATSLSRSFGGVTAVSDVSLRVDAGETVGLIGANGAGKTTLLELLGGFVRADHGKVHFKGENVSRLRPQARARLGLVRSFQDAALFPTMTVQDVVEVALERTQPTVLLPALLGFRRTENRRRQRAAELISRLGLADYRDARVSELSTGTRRVVELACIIALSPTMLLLDEPSSGIAQRETEALGGLLRNLKEELGLTMVIVEHDIPLVMGLADRIVVMDAGHVIASGTPDEIRDNKLVADAYLGTDQTTIMRSGMPGSVAASAQAAISAETEVPE